MRISEWSEGLLAVVTRSFAPANVISWLSVSFVRISAGRNLWGKKTVWGPHVFSEQAGTSCPCYRAWYISSKTDLSLDTLFFCEFCRTQGWLLKSPLNLPLRLGRWTAPWSPLVALSMFTPCTHTSQGQGESGFKRATQGLVTGILHPQGHPHILRIKETCCVKAGTDTAPLLNVSHSLNS